MLHLSLPWGKLAPIFTQHDFQLDVKPVCVFLLNTRCISFTVGVWNCQLIACQWRRVLFLSIHGHNIALANHYKCLYMYVGQCKCTTALVSLWLACSFTHAQEVSSNARALLVVRVWRLVPWFCCSECLREMMQCAFLWAGYKLHFRTLFRH